ncbi:MAG: hypothetical protein IRZ32_07500 [Solirubrobacteraceae bacterium]|nr:hypothetical protein [Solirubrobacteraceae bacterium]
MPRRLPVLAAVGLSQQRLVVCAAGKPLIDVTWDSGMPRELELGLPDEGLRIAWDAERFGGPGSGRVELLLKLPQATAIAAAIEQRRRPLEPRRRLRDQT